jgi:hypothetical protein
MIWRKGEDLVCQSRQGALLHKRARSLLFLRMKDFSKTLAPETLL